MFSEQLDEQLFNQRFFNQGFFKQQSAQRTVNE